MSITLWGVVAVVAAVIWIACAAREDDTVRRSNAAGDRARQQLADFQRQGGGE